MVENLNHEHFPEFFGQKLVFAVHDFLKNILFELLSCIDFVVDQMTVLRQMNLLLGLVLQRL
jgi:hypothetical protein